MDAIQRAAAARRERVDSDPRPVWMRNTPAKPPSEGSEGPPAWMVNSEASGSVDGGGSLLSAPRSASEPSSGDGPALDDVDAAIDELGLEESS